MGLISIGKTLSTSLEAALLYSLIRVNIAMEMFETYENQTLGWLIWKQKAQCV